MDDWLARDLDELAALLPPGPSGEDLRTALAAASQGGKRFRPGLVADVHRALGGDDRAAVAAVGAGVELLHTAFVVHDDVIDGDDVRRGAPSVPGRFRRAALAEDADPRSAATRAVAGAVLTGDLALVLAMRAFATAPVGPDVRARLLDLATEAIAVSAAGELADVRLAARLARPSTDDVLSVAERKTAWYSFALPMQLGALLAGADEATVAELGEGGLLLGIAFQLYDDLAGTFGRAEATGKSSLADLREGKATLLIAHARTTASWPLVAPVWGDEHLTDSRAAAAREVLQRCGSRAYVEQVAAEHLAAGLDRVVAAGLRPEMFAWMAGLQDRCAVPTEAAAG
ncbi:polyprenyl synthetase family protein [Nocardioides sp. CER19]|uniref:polyprenyl synthetase family protein n=1 Tax=Nocardioides sp. CER19 TaxID=3038538 RepID=UPI00244CB334|nr:polyprenyl synthetase family protein [Nocardioides sp. CER19]MDH2416241.1 polyprenyl synthetase family protein [Nocardioides sp. CER19]